MESGGNSSWGNAPVQGIVMIDIKTTGLKNAQTTYSIILTDTAGHGVDDFIESDTLARGNIKTSGATEADTTKGPSVTFGSLLSTAPYDTAKKCVEQ